MALMSQNTWFCTLQTTIQKLSQKPTNFLCSNNRNSPSKLPKIITFAVDNSNEESFQKPNSSNSLEISKPDRIKLAFERAQKYKKSFTVNDGVQKSIDNPIRESGRIEKLPDDKTDGKEEVPDAVGIQLENENKGHVNDDKSYKEKVPLRGNEGEGGAEVSDAVRIAMGKALEYKKKKSDLGSSSSLEKSNVTGLKNRDASNSMDETIKKDTNKRDDLKVSSIDFVGLGFADKKSSRGLPAGLVPILDPFPDSNMQEVEIIVGDASRFGNATSSETEKNIEEEGSDLYKPKVSTWGVFPRPSNISETFGGGRTIRPGEALETSEDRAAKEAQTRQLLAAYKRKIGLNINPKLKAECEKALNDGDSLMDRGRLKEALPYYQKVMDNLPFQTELHGLAALQWSISQDSLGRTEEARTMYEKLQTHPVGQVSKKAKQFMFSFQAMELLKVTKSSVSPGNTGYGSYFEAFVENKPSYSSDSNDVQEDGISKALPYIIIFLSCTILLVLFAAVTKGI